MTEESIDESKCNHKAKKFITCGKCGEKLLLVGTLKEIFEQQIRADERVKFNKIIDKLIENDVRTYHTNSPKYWSGRLELAKELKSKVNI